MYVFMYPHMYKYVLVYYNYIVTCTKRELSFTHIRVQILMVNTWVRKFNYYYNVIIHYRTCGGLHFTMTSQLPMGAGLGSSAAFAVSFAGAMLSATGKLTSTIKANNSSQKFPKCLKAKLPTINCTVQSMTSFCDWSNDDLDLINKWSFTVEQIIHGTPSGIDNSISCHGEHYIELKWASFEVVAI